MQIQLNVDASPMWFLGEPKNIVLSLNYQQPGPVEVDFDELEESLQKKLLISIRDGIIISDISFQNLYQVWLKSRPTVEETPPEDPQAAMREAIARQAAERVAKREKELREKEEKFQKRCRQITEQSLRALKTMINEEKDERTVRHVLAIEEQEKQRSMVIRFLHEKLRQIEAKRARDIERKTKKQIKSDKMKRQTSPMTVVESEMETVTLTPEDLIEAVVAEPGGV